MEKRRKLSWNMVFYELSFKNIPCILRNHNKGREHASID